MPDTILSVVTLGLGGVDVDTDPILTAPNVTLKSQNATVDPTSARAGALLKRPGLDRFNTVSLGGPLLGGIEAPFAGTAGAPASGGGGGGNAGDSGGTTDGQPAAPGGGGYGGGPGSSTISASSASGSTGAGLGAAQWNGGKILYGGKKLIVIGLNDGSSGTGWYVTSKGFADIAQLVTGTGQPHLPARLDRVASSSNPRYILGQTANHDQVIGFPQSVTEGMAARPNGVLFYPQSIVPAQSTGPTGNANLPPIATIRRNDGASDIAVATIPVNWWVPLTPPPVYTNRLWATGHCSQVVGMGTKYGDGSKIYIGVHDMLGVGGVTITNDAYRLFRLDTTTYSLTEIFNSTPGTLLGYPPNYNSFTGTASPFLSGGGFEAWFGQVNQATGISSSVFALVPSPGVSDNYANWKGFEGAFAAKGDVTCMAIYKGDLYVGHSNLDASATYAVINALPIKSVSLPGNPSLTASGGAGAAANNGFGSMAIFQGNLYVSYLNIGQIAKIYKFDGTTWSTVFTSGTFAHDQTALNLHVDSDGDILYAFGTKDALTTGLFMISTNGTTWVDKSANLTGNLSGSGGGNFTNCFPHNVFADFNQ